MPSGLRQHEFLTQKDFQPVRHRHFVFTAEVVDDIKRAMLSVNPDGYSLAVLSGSVGYLVDKLEPQIVPLKSVVDRMPAGLAGPAVSTTRGLQNVLEELVIAPPVVWSEG